MHCKCNHVRLVRRAWCASGKAQQCSSRLRPYSRKAVRHIHVEQINQLRHVFWNCAAELVISCPPASAPTSTLESAVVMIAATLTATVDRP
eukprot:1560200-Pleurochrysis_carterae.AAC.2